MRSTDPITFAFQRGFGPWLTPLLGKVPVYMTWTELPPVTEETVREWIETGYNVGLRTGAGSGLIVIDDDQKKHDVPDNKRFVPPPTDLISESPTGGRHYFYRAPDPCPGNSANKLAPYVDVRGEGGQVVYPGSSHPVLHRPYRWISTGEPGVFPEIEKPKTVKIDMNKPAPATKSNGWAGTALHQEVHSVRTAAEGSRNDALNRAAFSLGQIVAGGALSGEQVRDELTAAATLAGLPEKEIKSTIRSGLTSGAKSPRTAPESSTATASRPTKTPTPTEKHGVLVPGSHVMPPDGEYEEVGTDSFASHTMRRVPQGKLYRRAGVVGQIHGTEFRTVAPDQMRTIVDEHVRLGAGKKDQGSDPPTYTVQFRTCTRDLAGIVLGYAETRGQIRDLQHLATHPVLVGSDFEVATPGWNEASGVYLTDQTQYEPLPLAEARAVLEDLVCDFPFKTPADRANYFGLMLTPVLRPAIGEPVPLHLIGSSIERTGKTKLAEIVLGCAVLGRPTPALQIGVREEEREKRITGALLAGHSVIHLDNLREFVDSPALASLLTSTVFQGRELGHSRILSLPNGMTIVATGNNIHATGEMAKRVVPVMLQPATDAPESRCDYAHPFLRPYVESERERAVGAILGLVEAWKAKGRPTAGVGFGGFERWAAIVGGIMGVAGYPEWLSNLATWRGDADDFSEELRALVKAWGDKWGEEWVPFTDLFDLADDTGLFARQLSHQTDRGRRTAFGQRVLAAAAGRVVLEKRIELAGRGRHRRARAYQEHLG